MLNELAARTRSDCPSAFAAYGYAVRRSDATVLAYDGQSLPRFLLEHGGHPHEYRAWLLANRIGSPFDEADLGRGRLVTVANTAADFPKNPDFVA
jgi:hypothetical protein